MADRTQATKSSSPDSIQDLIRSIELPSSLPSVVQEFKDTAVEIVDAVMPDRPVTDTEGGTVRAAQHAVTDVATGAHKSVLKGTLSLPKPPVPAAVAARTSAATSAMAATRGSKFFGGLLKGSGRLLGRLVAPLLFAADVVSEDDKLRGVAKGAGGLAASSAGWMAGSTLGTGIGTLIMPGVGTAAGYFIGGAIGAAVAYGFGRDLGVKGYDKLLENKPAIMSGLKKMFSFGVEKGKSLLKTIIEGIATHAPPMIEKGNTFLNSTMERLRTKPSQENAEVEMH